MEFLDCVKVNTDPKNKLINQSSHQKFNFAKKKSARFFTAIIILILAKFLHCFSLVDKGGGNYEEYLVGEVIIRKNLFVVMTSHTTQSFTMVLIQPYSE